MARNLRVLAYSNTDTESAQDALARFLEAGNACYFADAKKARAFAWQCMDEREREIEQGPSNMTLPNPVTIELNSTNGPKIIYPRNSDEDCVEMWCPVGWTIDWETTPAQCGIGYVASPLIRT